MAMPDTTKTDGTEQCDSGKQTSRKTRPPVAPKQPVALKEALGEALSKISPSRSFNAAQNAAFNGALGEALNGAPEEEQNGALNGALGEVQNAAVNGAPGAQSVPERVDTRTTQREPSQRVAEAVVNDGQTQKSTCKRCGKTFGGIFNELSMRWYLPLLCEECAFRERDDLRQRTKQAKRRWIARGIGDILRRSGVPERLIDAKSANIDPNVWKRVWNMETLTGTQNDVTQGAATQGAGTRGDGGASRPTRSLHACAGGGNEALKSLWLSGPCGVGKTYLAVAVMREFILNMDLDFVDEYSTVLKPVTYPIFTTVPNLMRRIISGFDRKPAAHGTSHGSSHGGAYGGAYGETCGETPDMIAAQYARAPLIVLDDFGAEKTSEYAVSTLYSIIDERYGNMKPFVITTNYPAAELVMRFNGASAYSGDRIMSRIAGQCMMIAMNGKDRRLAGAAAGGA